MHALTYGSHINTCETLGVKLTPDLCLKAKGHTVNQLYFATDLISRSHKIKGDLKHKHKLSRPNHELGVFHDTNNDSSNVRSKPSHELRIEDYLLSYKQTDEAFL